MILDSETNGVSVGSRTFSASTATARTSTTWYMRYSDVPEFLSNVNLLTGK